MAPDAALLRFEAGWVHILAGIWLCAVLSTNADHSAINAKHDVLYKCKRSAEVGHTGDHDLECSECQRVYIEHCMIFLAALLQVLWGSCYAGELDTKCCAVQQKLGPMNLAADCRSSHSL